MNINFNWRNSSTVLFIMNWKLFYTFFDATFEPAIKNYYFLKFQNYLLLILKGGGRSTTNFSTSEKYSSQLCTVFGKVDWSRELSFCALTLIMRLRNSSTVLFIMNWKKYVFLDAKFESTINNKNNYLKLRNYPCRGEYH